MIGKWVLISVAAAVLATTWAGCGNDGGSNADLSKGALVAKGDRICWEAMKAQEAAFQKAMTEGVEEEATEFDPARQKAFIEEVTGAVHGMVEELADLGSVSGDEGTMEHLLAAYESGASEAEKNPQSYLSGDAFKKADQAARAYGFNKCGSI